jgi:hypothetical protein
VGDPIRALVDPPPREPNARRCCEFCECQLTSAGEVLVMSQKARELRRQEETLTTERTAHGETKTALAAAHTKIAELEQQIAAAAPAAKKQTSWGITK